ncbi:putative Rieske (2Fe-2S) domain-containing protein [Sphingobium herbicidovorans NBRC 16415]|uniref:Rieske (2Fe-2S) domain-containing protein n=2 Tax=Sphingomonadaceae TaxID=41297 RepID=A0A086P8W1_SPHHM|nr:putative Rieske (2Fe-2S) domain-containing protein [Sphingobium herbicidovorans NBRC 16415]
MLSHADNMKMCQTGRGTPMGEALRRFWIPVLLSE